ncbi:MAG: hypothetical protein Kow0099_32240 [Candidatus Abyssubacteria bacterium]
MVERLTVIGAPSDRRQQQKRTKYNNTSPYYGPHDQYSLIPRCRVKNQTVNTNRFFSKLVGDP